MSNLTNKQQYIKDIYNDSVKLLELLNTIIPTIDRYNANPSETLLQDVADKCFELGANIHTSLDVFKKEKEEENDCYPYGA